LKRIKDGSRYQKKEKSEEGNRVHRKNEKNLGESKDSIKESARRNEETGR